MLGAYLNGVICVAIAAGVILARDRWPGSRRTVVPTTLSEAAGTARATATIAR